MNHKLHRAAYAFAIAALTSMLVQHVRAERGERLQQVRAERGERLQLWDPLARVFERSGAALALELNGHTWQLTTSTLASSTHDVLERFDHDCAEAAAAAGGEATTSCQIQSSAIDGTALSYLTVRPTPGGATHALGAQSRESLRLREMFPEEGDASGHDFADLPRPQGARRILSAQLLGQPYGMVAYVVRGSSARAALQNYARELRRAGYRELRVSNETGDPRAITSFVRDDTQYIAHSFELAGESVIAAVRIGSQRVRNTFSNGDGQP